MTTEVPITNFTQLKSAFNSFNNSSSGDFIFNLKPGDYNFPTIAESPPDLINGAMVI